MKVPRHPVTIERTNDSAIICMRCDGLIRCRTMPFYILDALVRACGEVRTQLVSRLLADRAFREAVPPYPQFKHCLLFHELAGVCSVQVVASCDGTDIEFCCAFYDLDNPSAPAVVLVSEQLDDFIHDATQVLIAAAASEPPAA